MSQFVDHEHYERFERERRKLESYHRDNKEYLAALYILTSDEEIYHKGIPYFSSHGFDSPGMFESVDFSHGYLLLARLAVNLFNNNEKVSPEELVSSLGEHMFNVAMNSIYIRKYGVV